MDNTETDNTETKDTLTPLEPMLSPSSRKKEHPEDVALMQCILCLLLVGCIFGLHWLAPEWQEKLLAQYRLQSQADPVLWVEQLLEQVQRWVTG